MGADRLRPCALILGVVCAACESEDTTPAVTVHVLASPGASALAGASTLAFSFHMTEPQSFERPLRSDGSAVPSFGFAFPGVEAVATVEVEARDAGGLVRGRGRSVQFLISAGRNEQVAVLVLRAGSFAAAPDHVRLGAARAHHTAVPILDQWLLVAGGADAGSALRTMEILDLLVLKFADPPPSMPASRSRAAAIPLDRARTAYFGGVGETSQVDLFDASTGRWSALPMPAGAPPAWVAPAFAAFEDGTALVMGGFDGSMSPVGEIARVTAGGVELLAATTARAGPTVTAIDTPSGPRALVFGGNARGEPSAELIDPAGGTSSPAGTPPDDARTRHAAVRVGPSRVLIAGGVGDDGRAATYVWRFDAACLAPEAGCDVWSTLGPALAEGPFFDAQGVAIDAAEGDPRVIFACGVEAGEAPMREGVHMDTAGSAPNRRPLRTPRSACALVRLQNGSIAVVGGLDATGASLASIEFLEPDRL